MAEHESREHLTRDFSTILCLPVLSEYWWERGYFSSVSFMLEFSWYEMIKFHIGAYNSDRACHHNWTCLGANGVWVCMAPSGHEDSRWKNSYLNGTIASNYLWIFSSGPENDLAMLNDRGSFARPVTLRIWWLNLLIIEIIELCSYCEPVNISLLFSQSMSFILWTGCSQPNKVFFHNSFYSHLLLESISWKMFFIIYCAQTLIHFCLGYFMYR